MASFLICISCVIAVCFAMYAQKTLVCGLATSSLAAAASSKRQVACTAAAISRPVLSGAEILDLSVAEHHNQTTLSSFGGFPANSTVSYCGVNVYVTLAIIRKPKADQQ